MASNSEILKKAREYERRADYDGAAAEYRKLTESDPCPPIALNLLGDLFHRKGEPGEAAKWYQKAVDRYAQEGLYGNAIGVCRKIIRQYPSVHSAIEQLGGLFFSQGLAREAVKHYMAYAARMAEAGDGEAVLRTATRVREILAGDPEVRERLGEIFLALSLPDEGAVDLRAAQQGYRERGRISDSDRVSARLLEVERDRPVDPLALLDEGEARVPLDVAVARDPEGPPAVEEVFEDLDHSRAEPIARSPATGKGPRRPPIEEEIEVLSPGEGPDASAALSDAPRSEGAGLGPACFERPVGGGRPGAERSDEDFVPVEEILREFQNGVSKIISKSDYQSHYDMGMSYKEMGLYEEALGEFGQAGASPELESSCDEMRASILIELGRPGECVRLLEGRIGRSETDSVGIRFLLGLAYEKMGDTEHALREYRAVGERDPNFRDVRERISQMSR